MRYHLRTLLIMLALGPPVLAVVWFVGEPIVANYLAQQRHKDVWIDVGGPGTIKEFSTNCTFEETDGESDPDAGTESP